VGQIIYKPFTQFLIKNIAGPVNAFIWQCQMLYPREWLMLAVSTASASQCVFSVVPLTPNQNECRRAIFVMGLMHQLSYQSCHKVDPLSTWGRYLRVRNEYVKHQNAVWLLAALILLRTHHIGAGNQLLLHLSRLQLASCISSSLQA
jgi:hypothetical protein